MTFAFNRFNFKYLLHTVLALVLLISWTSINVSNAEMMNTSGLLNIQWSFIDWVIISEKQYLAIYTKFNNTNSLSEYWANINGKDYWPYSYIDTNKDKFFINSDNTFWFVARRKSDNDMFILNWKEYSKVWENTYYSISQSKNHSLIYIDKHIYIDWKDIWIFESANWYSFFIWNDWTYAFSYADWIYSNWVKYITTDYYRPKTVRNGNGSFGYVSNWKTYIKLNLDLTKSENNAYLEQIKGNWIIKEWGLIEFNYYADSFTFSSDWKHYSFTHWEAINIDGKDVNILSWTWTSNIKYKNFYALPKWKDWNEILSNWGDWAYITKTTDKLTVVFNWTNYDLPNDRDIWSIYLIKWGFIVTAIDKSQKTKFNINWTDIAWTYWINIPSTSVNDIGSYTITTSLPSGLKNINHNGETYWPFKGSISNIIDDPTTKHFSFNTGEWLVIDWKVVKANMSRLMAPVTFNDWWYWTTTDITSSKTLLLNWKELTLPNQVYKIRLSNDNKYWLIGLNSSNSNFNNLGKVWILKLSDIFQPKKTETLSWTLVNTWIITTSNNKNDILLKDWIYPNYEAVYNDNLNRFNWILSAQKSSVNSNKKIPLLLSHLDINGYQSYPYVTDTPNITSMDENNSFLTFITVPTDYEVKSVNIWATWWKEFITKLWWSCWTGCFKVLVTPTKERVMKTMSIWDKQDYDVNIIYSVAMWEEKTLTIKNWLTYKFWFNFERDAFQFNNTRESFKEWLPSLLLLKLIYPELKILNKWQELSLADLRNNNFRNWIFSISDIDISYPWFNNEKINTVLTWMKIEFIWYCFWITKKSVDFLSDTKKLWGFDNIKNISDIKTDSLLKKSSLEFPVSNKENLFLYDIIGFEWFKQITNILTKLKFNNQTWIFPINISYISKTWEFHGHSILGYKYEKINDISRYKLYVSDDWTPVFIFDSDNNWVFSESECLIRDKTKCSLSQLKQIKLESLSVIQTYDNDFNDYIESTIFIYNDTFWALNTINNYHWSINDNSLKTITTWNRKSFSQVLDNIEQKFLK